MRSPSRSALILTATSILGLHQGLLAQQYRLIDVPGGVSTEPRRINAQGDILGLFRDSAYLAHGFMLRGGTFVYVDAPQARETLLNGINERGDIVGGFRSFDSFPAFLLRDGAFQLIAPNTFSLQAVAINNRGDIAGSYLTARFGGPDRLHGFVLRGETFTDIAIPGASYGTAVTGINDSGDIVGHFGNPSNHGFLLRDGKLTSFDVPGAQYTNAYGINNRGDIVGDWGEFRCDANNACANIAHGYLVSSHSLLNSGDSNRKSEIFQIIDYPNALYTTPMGINDRGDIVGRAGSRGFLISENSGAPTSKPPH